MTRRAALLAVLLLAGCGEQDSDPAPGAATAGEARALDEAAEMLKHQRLPKAQSSPARGGGSANR